MNRILHITILTLIFTWHSYAQIPDTTIYKVVEVMPEYTGGDHELMTLMRTAVLSVKLPSNTVISRMVAQMVIEPDSSVSNIEIIRLHLLPAVDDESEKQIKQELITYLDKMSPWIPGKQKGTPVRVQYTFPITINYQ